MKHELDVMVNRFLDQRAAIKVKLFLILYRTRKIFVVYI